MYIVFILFLLHDCNSILVIFSTSFSCKFLMNSTRISYGFHTKFSLIFKKISCKLSLEEKSHEIGKNFICFFKFLWEKSFEIRGKNHVKIWVKNPCEIVSHFPFSCGFLVVWKAMWDQFSRDFSLISHNFWLCEINVFFFSPFFVVFVSKQLVFHCLAFLSFYSCNLEMFVVLKISWTYWVCVTHSFNSWVQTH